MGLKDDLQKEVKDIFAIQWQIRDGKKVPETEDLNLGNDAVKIKATVLYADLAESTSLVDNQKPHFAAEIYNKKTNQPEKAKLLYEQLIFNHQDSIYFIEARNEFRKLRGDKNL